MKFKQVTFEHITGSRKDIPGVPDHECSPKLRSQTMWNAEAGMNVPMLVPALDQTISIVLLNEDFTDLTEEELKLPKRLQTAIEDENVEEWHLRKKANRDLLNKLEIYEKHGEIRIIAVKDLSPRELLETKSTIVSLSEIAIADHIARGIEIPGDLAGGKTDTERTRARNAINAEANAALNESAKTPKTK